MVQPMTSLGIVLGVICIDSLCILMSDYYWRNVCARLVYLQARLCSKSMNLICSELTKLYGKSADTE
jgi:hypothetical protein